jgi:hypothetical protein
MHTLQPGASLATVVIVKDAPELIAFQTGNHQLRRNNSTVDAYLLSQNVGGGEIDQQQDNGDKFSCK